MQAAAFVGSPGETSRVTRRAAIVGAVAAFASSYPVLGAGQDTLRFALTPVFLTSDLELLDRLRLYLETVTKRPVELVARRTYQEITALLTAGQVDAAWLCGFPFVQHRTELDLLAVPIWQGKPLYQSYLIAGTDNVASGLGDLRGGIHAFSDPDSNSGYLVTAAGLANMKETPDSFFRQTIFTYGHSNVVRAVAAGLAQSGSVDGYVYEVLKAVNPGLISSTTVLEASDWFGFPPIAAPASARGSEKSAVLAQALLTMHREPIGRDVLELLRLDRFATEPVSIFDSIEANMRKVRSIA